ncbi:hypothetical protein OKW49_005312 [Paraburkholderia youngii]|uniref:hypothetical protein n=1 Tax=Paraburkholderia youngii TaxID=2782701 RepID=UPI003D1FCA3F
MIINISDCWKNAKTEHISYFDTVVLDRLKQQAAVLGEPLYEFLNENHKKIRDGDALIFLRVQRKLNALLRPLTSSDQKAVKDVISKIYDYDLFSKKREDVWCAYKLCAKAVTLTCPYCNLAYGHTLIIDDEGKVRPTLDHFFDKATYPLFAISLGNLIPSCSSCNSSLKGTKDFLINKHLHPFTSTEKLKILFDIDPLEARWDATAFDTANIKIHGGDKNTRARNSLRTFFLEERYKFLVDEARVIAKGIVYYQSGTELFEGGYQWAVRGITSDNYRNQVLERVRNFQLDLVSWCDDSTQAIPD